jgi:hypothetical protein
MDMIAIFQFFFFFYKDISGWHKHFKKNERNEITVKISQMFNGATAFSHSLSLWKVPNGFNIAQMVESSGIEKDGTKHPYFEP